MRWRDRKRVVLAHDVHVRPSNAPMNTPLKLIPKGALRRAIPRAELRQLCDDHFVLPLPHIPPTAISAASGGITGTIIVKKPDGSVIETDLDGHPIERNINGSGLH